MQAVLRENYDTRRLVAGWCLLALSALALFTVYAILAVVARTPLLNSFDFARDLFRSSLVLHVNFAVIVWLLVCAAGIWTLASGQTGNIRRSALMLAGVGAAAMAVAPFIDSSTPILSNYVPVLNGQIFLTGLVGFISGVILSGAASFGGIVQRLTRHTSAKRDKYDVWRVGALLSVIAAVMAFVALGASMLSTGVPGSQAGFETLFWGPGHVLQFVHVLLMMTVWIVLGECVLGGAIAPRRWLTGLLLFAALPVLVAPFIHIYYAVGSPDFRHAYTELMIWGAWPAAMLLGGRLALLLFRAGRGVWVKPEMFPLALSLLLFALGCILGASINGETTLVTAHYHGTVGAVAVAYMGLGYHLLPSFGYTVGSGRLARWQLAIYGSGLLALVSALAWLGTMGVPRKTPYVDQAAQTAASMSAMGLMGLGGLLSLIGTAMFVFSVGRSIWLRDGKAPARDVRKRALYITAILVIAGGLLISFLPGRYGTSLPDDTALAALPETARVMATNATVANTTASTATNEITDTTVVMDSKAAIQAKKEPAHTFTEHAQQKGSAEIERRFEQGVVMLHASRYEEAVTAFHRVLLLNPDLPEANVNMGYALMGLGRYNAAKDFFEGAIELRKDQNNAYYGLAEALAALHDLSGAIGAMRTYQHLSPKNDAYQQQAEAMVKAWQGMRERLDSEVKPTK